MHTKFSVFDAIEREDDSVGQHSEPTAVFLNRVAGPYWDQVRELIERWAESYPDEAKPDLIGRLRSPDNRQWGGAFWELYLHESFLRSGYSIEVHPSVAGRARQPDFLVTSSISEFYVEAKCVFGEEATGQDALLRGVFDAINSITSPNFFVDLHVDQIGTRAPSTRGLKVQLEAWLSGLDPDDVNPTALLEETDKQHRWVSDDWVLQFRPFPIRSDARGRPNHRPLGMWSAGQAIRKSDEGSLRRALKKKGTAYGQLDRPLLLAMNLFTGFDRTFETMNALYGAATLVFNAGDPDGARNSRNADGYFGYPAAWRHRHIAGVLIGPNVGPWTVGGTAPTYWTHPAPEGSILPLEIWHRATLEGDQVETTPAETQPYELFGLAADWPLGDPFPND